MLTDANSQTSFELSLEGSQEMQTQASEQHRCTTHSKSNFNKYENGEAGRRQETAKPGNADPAATGGDREELFISMHDGHLTDVEGLSLIHI